MNAALWTPEQRQWLQAMGHTVWQVATPGSTGASEPVDDRDARREAAELLREQPRPQRRPPAAAPTASVAAPDRLMSAVLRAARRAPGDAQVTALLPDSAVLRGNAAAKRALWPHLRALRRTERGA